MIALYVVLGLLVVVVAWTIATYNGLVSARNRTDEAWSGVDVQLKRRHDLVPNLVATVKGYAEHERGTLQAVVDARTAAQTARTPAERGRAEGALTAALSAVAEQYPQLRAVESFTQLQAELTQIEDEIQAARRIYNANAQRYRTLCESFPTMIVAHRGPFAVRELFTLEQPAVERAVPTVSFS